MRRRQTYQGRPANDPRALQAAFLAVLVWAGILIALGVWCYVKVVFGNG